MGQQAAEKGTHEGGGKGGSEIRHQKCDCGHCPGSAKGGMSFLCNRRTEVYAIVEKMRIRPVS